MDATVIGIGAVVVAELRSGGYLESTIGQYEKSIKVLAGSVGSRGTGVYGPSGAIEMNAKVPREAEVAELA